jgi:vanillate O-demethylase monooxygenase subunit
MFIRDRWYVAGWSHEFTAALLPRRICDEPIVFFRTGDGAMAAMEDRCPHRRLPLSLGRLVGDEVQCGYHGLRVGPDGRCTFAPGATGLPQRPILRVYPIVDRHGFVWIWIGENDRADPATIPNYDWHVRPDWEADHFYVHIRAEYRLGLDNLLDLSHAAYVHGSNVGNAAIAACDPDVLVQDGEVVVRRDMRDVDNSRTMAELTGLPRSDNLRSTIFRPPGDVRIETIYEVGSGTTKGPRREIQVLTPLTPETSQSHHQFLTHCRDFRVEPGRRARFIEDIRGVMEEDRVILEAQQRSIDSEPANATWLGLRIDRGPKAARRLLDSELRRVPL